MARITSHLPLVTVASLVFVTLSFFGIRAALATHYASLNTREGLEAAVRLEADDPEKWHSLGRYWQYNSVKTDMGRAIRAYETSLTLNPQSAAAWLDLASAYETEGESESARRAFVKAKHVYPVSADVLWRYGNFLLRQEELESAFAEVHSAIEEDHNLGREAIRVCRHVQSDFKRILHGVLPPIADVYSDAVWELTEEGDSEDALEVWAELIALHPSLHEREVGHFVDGLLLQHRTSDAERVWRQAIPLMDLPKLDDPQGSLIWDGGFETNVTLGGLAWYIYPPRSVMVSYDQNVKHSGLRALRLDIDQKDVSDSVGVCQRVVVEPKTAYEFSAWVRTEHLAKEGGIFFRLATPGLPVSPVFETAKLGGTNEWTKISMRWTSPDESHLAQVCLARSREYDPERGIAWVDDVSLLKFETRTKGLK